MKPFGFFVLALTARLDSDGKLKSRSATLNGVMSGISEDPGERAAALKI